MKKNFLFSLLILATTVILTTHTVCPCRSEADTGLIPEFTEFSLD